MCLNPIRLPNVCGDAALIPCGKCAECMKTKANELTVRAVREAEYLKNFYFVTLTYDNEHIPLQVTEGYLDDDFNDHVTARYISDDSDLRKEFFEKADFTWQVNKDGKRSKRYEPYKFYSDFAYDKDNVFEDYKLVYYTTDNEDFKRFMKRARMGYFRHFGKSLPKFKYLCVPEMGTVTYRPHNHVLFFGLDREQINFMLSYWQQGSVADVQQVSYTIEDMGAVAHYVSKYATKGSAECPYVVEGLCKKPRKCFSFNFGVGDEEDLERRTNYWTCKDKYGDYDINNLSAFTPEQKAGLTADVMSRRYYDLCGYKYPIPQYLKKRVFYVKRSECDLQALAKINPKKTLTYEEKKQLPTVFTTRKSIDKRTGAIKYRVCTPSPTAKVASELQSMVTVALFEHLRGDAVKSMGRQVKDEFRRAGISEMEPMVEVTYENLSALTDAFVRSQKDTQASAELHLLNDLYRSIY